MSVLPYRFRLDRQHTLYQGLEYAGLAHMVAPRVNADQAYLDSGPHLNQSATLDGVGWVWSDGQSISAKHVFHGTSQARILIPNIPFNDSVGTIVLTYYKFGFSGSKWDYVWDCLGSSRTLFAFGNADQVWLYTNNGDRGSLSGMSPYTNFTWHTLVLIWGNNDLYVDGSFHGSFANGGLGSDVGTFVLGDRQSGTVESIYAFTQKFMVYSRALTSSEIETVSNFPDQFMDGFVQRVPETKRHFFVTAPPLGNIEGEGTAVATGSAELTEFTPPVLVTGIFEPLIIGV